MEDGGTVGVQEAGDVLAQRPVCFLEFGRVDYLVVDAVVLDDGIVPGLLRCERFFVSASRGSAVTTLPTPTPSFRTRGLSGLA